MVYILISLRPRCAYTHPARARRRSRVAPSCRFMHTNHPVVAEDPSIKHWPAWSAWSADELDAQHGDTPFTVSENPYASLFGSTPVNTTFREFLQVVMNQNVTETQGSSTQAHDRRYIFQNLPPHHVMLNDMCVHCYARLLWCWARLAHSLTSHDQHVACTAGCTPSHNADTVQRRVFPSMCIGVCAYTKQTRAALFYFKQV